MKTVPVYVMALSLIALTGATAHAEGENCTSSKAVAVCTEDVVKKETKWACDLIEKKGREALAEISAMRYDCCGEPDYVWIQDMKPMMIMHPIKKELNNQDLSDKKDPKGKKLFVEFVDATKKTPSGAWVEYMWPKFGEKDATPKKSWVMKCKVGNTSDYWIAGSGTWK